MEHPFSAHGSPVFDWDSYLKETSSTAAPAYCFKQVSFVYSLISIYLTIFISIKFLIS